MGLTHSCFLDLAEDFPGSGEGAGMTLEKAGEVLDLTRERVRQIESKAFGHARREAQNPEDVEDLVAALSSGSLEGAATAGWVMPPGGPVLTEEERTRSSRAFTRMMNQSNSSLRCRRVGCNRTPRPTFGRSFAILAGYCSLACARRDGVVAQPMCIAGGAP